MAALSKYGQDGTLQFHVPTEDNSFEYVTATIYDWKEEGPGVSRSGAYIWYIGG